MNQNLKWKWLLKKKQMNIWPKSNRAVGIYECLESGWLNNVMERDRLLVQREKAEGKRLLVGVNAFQGEEGPINKAIRNVAYKTPFRRTPPTTVK